MKKITSLIGAIVLHVGMIAQTEYHRVATEQPQAFQDFTHNVEEIIIQDGQVHLLKSSGVVEYYDINTLDKMSFFDCQDHVFHPEFSYGNLIDIDGNTYKTIEINGEVWMAENLRTTRFNNGDSIANILAHSQWISTSAPAWCHYNNDPIYECPYGKLYNTYVSMDPRNVCPVGWHVSTIEEYAAMVGSYGGTITSDDDCCGALKSPGNYYWQGAEVGANNASGTSAASAKIQVKPTMASARARRTSTARTGCASSHSRAGSSLTAPACSPNSGSAVKASDTESAAHA
jgi:uncharacterized protein (TIGR02145 family)